MSADGSHITAPDEEGRGAARAMKLCLDDAGLGPDAVDYINAHGTSTGLGDLAETTAMKTVFGPHAKRLQISSTKSELGHLLGASGGVELIASALAIHTGVLPPTINLDHPDEELRPRLHPQRRPRDARRTMSCPTASASADITRAS